MFSMEHKEEALRLMGLGFEHYLDGFYKGLNEFYKASSLVQEETTTNPGMGHLFPRIGKGTIFEVASYLLFRLDWTMHHEKRKTEERKDILAHCEQIVISKLRRQYNASDEDFRSTFYNRYEIYARGIMPTGVGEKGRRSAFLRFTQLMMHFCDSTVPEKAEIPLPLYVYDVHKAFPLQVAMTAADKWFGTGLEFMLRHVFNSCADIRILPPHLLKLLLMSGQAFAEEIMEDNRARLEQKEEAESES